MSITVGRQLRRVPHLGGSVTVTPIRARLGEGEQTFAVSWHSPSGDVAWLSPRLPSEDVADAAGRVLATFVGATVRR